jgi:hypothetical protein
LGQEGGCQNEEAKLCAVWEGFALKLPHSRQKEKKKNEMKFVDSLEPRLPASIARSMGRGGRS